MNRSDDEKLTNIVIGQAILSLLYENGPVHTQALIARLKVMETHESEPDKRAVIASAIADISTGSLAAKHLLSGEGAQAQQDRERRDNKNNVYSLFGDRQRSGSGKKH